MSRKPKQGSLRYWLEEIEEGIQDEQSAHIRIGKALFHLRGEKYRKADHMWRQDNPPIHVSTFAQYCKWKWNWEKTKVQRYILAYEVYSDIKEEVPIGTSSQPESESVLRPLSRLKSKDERQHAFELAGKFKPKGAKITAKDTAKAVEIVKGVKETMDHVHLENAKSSALAAHTEAELRQIEEEGIATQEAYTRIDKSWRKLIEGENEKAIKTLARLYIEFLEPLV